MIKHENTYKSIQMDMPLRLGERAIITVEDFDGTKSKLRTSRIRDYMAWADGSITIETNHSIYRGECVENEFSPNRTCLDQSLSELERCRPGLEV